MTQADFKEIREFLLESSPLYPGIGEWWNRKVLPDMLLGRRSGLILEEEGRLVGLAIAKRGKHAKLCSIRIRDGFRNRGLGKDLLRALAGELCAAGVQEVYVTLSEALDEGPRRFFEALGFVPCGRLKEKYLTGVDELVYSWPREAMLLFLDDPCHSLFPNRAPNGGKGPGAVPDLLMSLKPEYAELVLEGRKRIEFRRRFSRRHVGATVLFYVSRTARKYQFTASISGVHWLPTEELWASFESEGGIDRRSFDAYFTGTKMGYAIRLRDVRPLREQLCLREARTRCPELRPPQSYKVLPHTAAFIGLWRNRLVQEGI
jgi:predicted transcriptional regulator/ribosomal protein S18 acetylase RimI-like enzyme